MKRKNLLLLFFMAFFTLSFTQEVRERVRHVYDGDTILLVGGERVRYLGIDAPEIGRDGRGNDYKAFAATTFNRRLVGNSLVRLEFDRERTDRHGRLLAFVFLEDGTMVNALLLRKGLAHVLRKPDLKYSSLLLTHQRQAMTERLGIWGRDPDKRENHYPASLRSYRFHRPGCPFGRQIHPRHLKRFDSRRDAFWEGFSPCRHCRP